MDVTQKRKRGAISYRELSSDDELTESSGLTTSKRSDRSRPSRRSARQRKLDDDGEMSQGSSPEALPDKRSSHAPRDRLSRGRATVSYKDISSDEEDPDAEFELKAERLVAVRTRARTTVVQPSPSQQSASTKGIPRRKAEFGAGREPNFGDQAELNRVDIPTDGHKPAWSTLPYHVLLQIFVYASHPLHDENMKPTSSIAWLVQMARICSTFTKPALTALYRDPPIFATRQTRKNLVYHLISPPLDGHIDYRVMVKRLELDATQMLALTDATNSVADLAALIQSLTTLREVDIFDPIDRPPFRDRLRRLRRWVYPNELFEALRQTQLRLRSWRWNSTFCNQGPLWIKSIHGDAAFQSLRELTLTKFHPDPTRDDRDNVDNVRSQPTTEELLASALAVLPNLKILSFETCGIVSEHLLPLLPDSLVSLHIINCGELRSDVLQAFLATHGAYLEELCLNHNQALDMSFIVDLKASCPRLEVLRMDTTYYSSLAMSSDNEPLYETLLGENERPSWPSSLRIIDMEYLRNWNATSASNFFGSLIDAAAELPCLQEITIMAMVDTDWRQRAVFRRQWSAKFRTVFARQWISPDPHLASSRAYREHKEQCTQDEKNDSLIEDTEAKVMEVGAVGLADCSDSDISLKPSCGYARDEAWGSKRLRRRSKAATNYDESSESETGTESKGEEASDESEVLFVQGRCHTVIFRIDNFRPREEIYNEGDFLDAEPSGDEEWNGHDDNEDETIYAW